MFRLILALLLLYMAYNNVRNLVAVPVSQWGGEQWVLLVVSIGLVGVSILSFVRYRREMKEKEAEKKQQALEMQKAEEEQRKKELAEWEAEAAQAAEENPARMMDTEGHLIEKELDTLDGFDELEEYELLGVRPAISLPKEAEEVAGDEAKPQE